MRHVVAPQLEYVDFDETVAVEVRVLHAAPVWLRFADRHRLAAKTT